MTKSSNWESTIKPILVLTLSSLVASLMLALVNSVTAPVIEANEKAATLVAYVEVLPTVSDATELEEITGYTTAGITGAVRAPTAPSPCRRPRAATTAAWSTSSSL